jgi:uncharacterized protein (DUF1501 family)
MSHDNIDRRAFLGSAAAIPLISTEPVTGFLNWLPGGESRALIVLEFDGGNDGLNTIFPADDRDWRKARPRLSSVRNGAHKLQDGYALHPGLDGVHRLMREGLATVVHGVGFPGASRSHFKNRDVWHTADPNFTEMKADTTGWLGRVADVMAKSGASVVPGLSVGSLKVPLILKSHDVVVPSVNRIEEYQLLLGPGGAQQKRREELVDLVKDVKSSDDLRGFLGAVAKSAVGNAEKLRNSLAGYKAKATFPNTALGRKLQLLSRIIVSGFGTRLFHVNYSGFDTHATQLPAHAGLMRQFSGAVEALVRDLKAHGKIDEVLIMVTSEFGRRVAQNRSRGTDHGKAGPMFLFGGGVKPGLHGEHPSLTDLDNGDLKATADFREVYAAALRWLKVAPKDVLGGEFKGVNPLA